jgi:hypothetical protein
MTNGQVSRRQLEHLTGLSGFFLPPRSDSCSALVGEPAPATRGKKLLRVKRIETKAQSLADRHRNGLCFLQLTALFSPAHSKSRTIAACRGFLLSRGGCYRRNFWCRRSKRQSLPRSGVLAQEFVQFSPLLRASSLGRKRARSASHAGPTSVRTERALSRSKQRGRGR